MEYKNNAIKEMMDNRIDRKYPGISTIEDVNEAREYIRFCDHVKADCYRSLDSFTRWKDILRKAQTKGIGSIAFHSDVLSFRKGAGAVSSSSPIVEYLAISTKYGDFYLFKDGSVSEYFC